MQEREFREILLMKTMTTGELRLWMQRAVTVNLSFFEFKQYLE